MIALTAEQKQAIVEAGDVPARVVDPETETQYVVIRADEYDRIMHSAEAEEQAFIEGIFPLMAEVFGPEGWDDPEMDIYNDFDPRRS